MAENSALRRIKPMKMPDVEPAPIPTAAPTFETVDPATLLVDDGYQRNLSDRSMRLIRKIVGHWDWRRFKPPVVARTAAGLEVIDGQHTALAAASHPEIQLIPVMVVDAGEQSDRAGAFIGHNRDRVNVTDGQMHFAAMAAGEQTALEVEAACSSAGVRLLKVQPGNGRFQIGDCMAARTVYEVVRRRGVEGAGEILRVLATAKCAPLPRAGIRAVEHLLHEDEYSGQVTADDLATALIALGPTAVDLEASVFAATHNVRLWKAWAVVLFRRARRGRRRAA